MRRPGFRSVPFGFSAVPFRSAVSRLPFSGLIRIPASESDAGGSGRKAGRLRLPPGFSLGKRRRSATIKREGGMLFRCREKSIFRGRVGEA